jgi:hypothetical protein
MTPQYLRIILGLALTALAPTLKLCATDLTDPQNAAILDRWGYVNVLAYGADPSGQRDSTKAIQAALDDGYSQGKAVLVPQGTFLISDTLRCYKTWSQAPGRKNVTPFPSRCHIIVGENRDGKRPLIKLAAEAPKFDDVENPRAMIVFANFCTADRAWSNEEISNIDPMRIPYGVIAPPGGVVMAAADLFDEYLSGVDFDCNRHAGGVGVLFPAAQKSVLADVKVNAAGAHTGIYGIPGRNMGAVNIEVVGGKYGLVITPSTAGATVVGLTLTGQTERAIVSKDFVPICIVGFSITKESAPVMSLESSPATSVGTMVFVDGTITLKQAGVALDNRNGKGIYARNVYVRGTKEFIQSGAEKARGGNGESFRVEEYCYTDQNSPSDAPPYKVKSTQFRTFSLVDGMLRQVPEPAAHFVANAVPPGDLVQRHLPAAIPQVSFRDSTQSLNVTDAPYNAVPDGRDNWAAIQGAIDDAEGLGAIVVIPKGKFLISRTLELKARTKLIGLGPRRNGRMLLCEISAHPTWQNSAANDTLIRTVNDPAAETFLGLLNLGAAEGMRNHIHWRAGRKSAMMNLGFIGGFSDNCVFLSGHGGGRMYLLEPQLEPASRLPASHRHIRIEGTAEPLSWYGCNLEAGKGVAANMEINSARNLRFYGIKREGRSPTLILNDSRNVGFFALGAMREGIAVGSGGYVQLRGASDQILVALAAVQSNLSEPSGEPLLLESFVGMKPISVIYPDSVSLYKRGELDDEAMGKEARN